MGREGLEEAYQRGYDAGRDVADDYYQSDSFYGPYSNFGDSDEEATRVEARNEIIDLIEKKAKKIPPTRRAEKEILEQTLFEIRNYT